MNVEVRLFAAAAEALGPRTRVAVDEPATVGAVRDALIAAHPEHAALLAQCSLALDREIVRETAEVPDGAEVALLPPFAGGSHAFDDSQGPRTIVGVQAPPLPVAETLEALGEPGAGGHVVFLGTVRDHSATTEQVAELTYAAYEDMAREVLATIAAELAEAWPGLRGIALIHSIGALPVGAHTVLVVTSAAHRDDAYAANRHALEQLKARVPVWKHERDRTGSARWIGVAEDAQPRRTSPADRATAADDPAGGR